MRPLADEPGATLGRRMRNVARRYVESLEAERADLKRQVAHLTAALDEQVRHHRDAHAACTDAPAIRVDAEPHDRV